MFEEELEKISSGKIYSSTETVIYALDLLNTVVKQKDPSLFIEVTEKILRSRVTSAMLQNIMRIILGELVAAQPRSFVELGEAFQKQYERATSRLREDVERSASIASRRISNGDVLLTNSYSLFVKKTIEKALRDGKELKVYVTESRPTGEGVRFAAELADMGVDTYLIVDSAARFFMKEVDKVLFSSEAISANGAVVNKVGTSLIALAAHEARVRVYVVSSTLKFSPETIIGELVEIPEIEFTEYIPSGWENLRKLKPRSPLFDVTPPSYIDAIITEKGVIAPEFSIVMLRESFGWPLKVEKVENLLSRLKNMLVGEGR
ncbi:translation initiation factor eIF-2B [Thermofilum pendens]|uniref:Initiation factor 2B related n=1 Tax=Thermofilum pendens (strain DSM 2475 / Hrk 5) TaxID=368408 RepID=A1RX64_THEPD|nr:initiation factor 2B-like protein [Thermofilum pendens]ABL77794.1 initiation factor 2B related [Thermofilum pendens Hrk 5]